MGGLYEYNSTPRHIANLGWQFGIFGPAGPGFRDNRDRYDSAATVFVVLIIILVNNRPISKCYGRMDRYRR